MRNCKNILSTALISDILDELGYKEQMLPIQIKPNFLAAKIFGRARIMTLKHLSKKENYKDVYKGLYFLETLKKGEILIVANGFSEHAFFGELMATLARNK
ncbi:MAG: cytidyltransferase, partial [Nanoarchaeota archaeon]|nr:cytidyltransferase [Nanoarchaeota archaeon]